MQLGKNRLWRLLALLAAATLVLGACGDDDDPEEDATGEDGGDGTGAEGGVECDGIALGFLGALTGANANLGIGQFRGMKLAVKEFNEENPDCQVEIKEFDSQGSPDQAPALAQQAVQDASIIGMIGPAFSGESRTGVPIFNQAKLSVFTSSATAVDLSKQGWTHWHRGLGNDGSQGPAIANYIKDTVKAKKVAVIDDKSEYGKGIADIIRKELGGLVAVNDSFEDTATEFSSTVTRVQQADVEVVVFGGYYSQGGPLAKQLKDGGVDALFIGPDGVLDPAFVTGAGDAAEGSILTAPSAPVSAVEGADEFTERYKEVSEGNDPGLYSLEGFDGTNIYLECIADGHVTREAIETCLDDGEFEGMTKTYTWDDTGELSGEVTIYLYKVENGEIVGVGPIE